MNHGIFHGLLNPFFSFWINNLWCQEFGERAVPEQAPIWLTLWIMELPVLWYKIISEEQCRDTYWPFLPLFLSGSIRQRLLVGLGYRPWALTPSCWHQTTGRKANITQNKGSRYKALSLEIVHSNSCTPRNPQCCFCLHVSLALMGTGSTSFWGLTYLHSLRAML